MHNEAWIKMKQWVIEKADEDATLLPNWVAAIYSSLEYTESGYLGESKGAFTACLHEDWSAVLSVSLGF